MVVWKADDGTKHDLKTQRSINLILKNLTEEEKFLYEYYTQYISGLFKNFNAIHCSKCDHPYRAKNDNGRGCCTDCGPRDGFYYLRYGNIIKRYFKFNRKYGFFDIENMRCSLPRQVRSSTCLRAHCLYNEEEKNFDKLVSKNDYEIRKLRKSWE